MLKKIITIGIILFLLMISFSSVSVGINLQSIKLNNISLQQKDTNLDDFTVETYKISTQDKSSITLTRYNGIKRPSIMLVHGMSVNHKIFDWDNNHSLARFLNKEGWDVWMLDLRTHDGDGDFIFLKNSDREYINRYWDFDKTLLKIDVVTAVDFIKEKSENDSIYFLGHSYGGYLAYAYAELIGEENLSGIITTGSSAMSTYVPTPLYKNFKYGIKIGNKVFVNPIGLRRSHLSYLLIQMLIKNLEGSSNGIFYNNTTPSYIKKEFVYSFDDEPAGVYVDMIFGKDQRLYGEHWVDPQTLYDYTANLNKITVPSLLLVGDEDSDDPMKDVYKTYENISSINKKFLHFAEHGHLDLLLGDNSSTLIFPEINNWLNSL